MPFWFEVYLWGLLPAWFICTVISARIHKVDRNDGEDLLMAVMIGACYAMFWPLCIPGYWVWEFLRHYLGSDKERK